MSKALVKSTTLVSSMTFISRILGFVRDMIVAQIFGVNAAVDAFNIAFKIPNFMRNLFAEGSFSQAFVPVLSNYRQTREKNDVQMFVGHMAGALGLILLCVTILGVFGAPFLTKLFAPGLDPYRFTLASEMLRVTFPYLMLISLTAFSSAILNSYGVFSVPSLTPALLNVCLIAAAFGFAQYFKVPIEAQAWGVLAAGFVQLFFQLPFLYRLGFLVWPRLNWKDAGVQRVLKLMIPALFGASVAQISLLINTIFASFLKVGSVTWLYYSERLAYFPLGVFGVALMTVILPHLSRQYATQSTDVQINDVEKGNEFLSTAPHPIPLPDKRGEGEQVVGTRNITTSGITSTHKNYSKNYNAGFSGTIDWGIRCNLLIGIPASLTMLILSGPLVATLFAYGKFNVYDVLMTQKSVIAYSIGLQSFMLVKVLSAAFYAQQDMKTPVRIAVITVVISVILNAILIFPLAHAGLALASSLGSWLNTIFLGWILVKRDIFRFAIGWGKFITRLLFANGVVALWLWWGSKNVSTWLTWHWQQRVLHLLVLGIVAIAGYIFCLWVCGMRPRDFKAGS